MNNCKYLNDLQFFINSKMDKKGKLFNEHTSYKQILLQVGDSLFVQPGAVAQ